MNRKIIAAIISTANELDVLGFNEEADTLTKLAQAYGRREIGPPTIIEVGPRGSFGQSSMLNEIDPTSRHDNEVIVRLHYPANETEKRLDGFNNIIHANNTARKIARNTKEQYGVDPQVSLYLVDSAYNKAYEMFMAGKIERLDAASVRELKRDMPERRNDSPDSSQRSEDTLTLVFDNGFKIIKNENGRVSTISGTKTGPFNDANHVTNYAKAILRNNPSFKIIDNLPRAAHRPNPRDRNKEGSDWDYEVERDEKSSW